MYGHFDILISQYGQGKKIMHFRVMPLHYNCSLPAHFHEDWALKHTSERIWAPQTCQNITQIPPRHPSTHPYTFQTPTDINRHQQTPTDITQTPLNTSRHDSGVSDSVCQCLVMSAAVFWCLIPLGGVRGVSRFVWDTFMDVSVAPECLEGYLRAQSLRVGA